MAIDRQHNPSQVVYTNKARCRDCYRCVRVCPVKAISMHKGQAFVEPERCLACGTCIRECPQGAKQFRSDIECAVRLLSSGQPVAVSLAPSFAATYSDWERKRLPSALRKLGFSYVAETAIGAFQVSERTAEYVREHPEDAHICTACPAVVSFVEKYEAELVSALTPIVSPMIAHAKHIKATLGENTRVVFIGPCVAKKAEADREEFAGLVDCVLTFRELAEWMERDEISLNACEESTFDEQPEGDARFFPVLGGSMRTSHLNTDLLAADVVSVSGIDDVREALESLKDNLRPVIIEPLFCLQGCINGPAISCDCNVYDRRQDLLRYAQEHPGLESGAAEARPLHTDFAATCLDEDVPVREDEIKRILALTGKVTAEDELNCGACGYNSCRDKAVAVIRGMAEPEMCIPYMKRLAEQRSDRIIETSPNGIVILDEKLNIISMNPTFRKFFMCSEAVLGKPISYLMDPDPFERLVSGAEEKVEMTARHDRYKLVTHQIMYALREEHQYAGIFVNITSTHDSQTKLTELRTQTLEQARELLEHQISMAQKMAQFLGESTAQGEQLVENLMEMTGQDEEKDGGEGSDWLWDTYTLR
ncbi:MAG: [Fe-Fe] hydrogenase large subunit C-terminal domain-containing protein [Armatimonadota bacterium]